MVSAPAGSYRTKKTRSGPARPDGDRGVAPAALISSLTHLVRGAAIRAILGGPDALIRRARGRTRGAVSYG